MVDHDAKERCLFLCCRFAVFFLSHDAVAMFDAAMLLLLLLLLMAELLSCQQPAAGEDLSCQQPVQARKTGLPAPASSMQAVRHLPAAAGGEAPASSGRRRADGEDVSAGTCQRQATTARKILHAKGQRCAEHVS